MNLLLGGYFYYVFFFIVQNETKTGKRKAQSPACEYLKIVFSLSFLLDKRSVYSLWHQIQGLWCLAGLYSVDKKIFSCDNQMYTYLCNWRMWSQRDDFWIILF